MNRSVDMNKPYKTLYRSRNNRIVGGVAAGLGEYLGVDPTLVRLIFVLVAIVGWIAPAVIVYLVMMFIVPEEPIGVVSTTNQAVTESPASPTAPVDTAQGSNAVVNNLPPEDQSSIPTSSGSA
jgi:phage shock protein C